MFCKFCGTELSEDANFCPRCGKIVDFTVPQAETEPEELPSEFVAEPEDTTQKEKDSLSKKILTFAILGCAFGIASWLSLLGLAFSIVSACLVRKYLKRYQFTEKKATIGRALSIVGIIVSTVFTITSIYDLVCMVISYF